MGAELPEAEYLAALRADLERSLPLIWGRKIISVFIGGGTPSLISAPGLDTLLSDIRSLLPLEAEVEITMEANPGTFEAAKFRAFAASGVNRLSVGVQSFNPAHLKVLGRIHDGDEARRAVDIARENFSKLNLDVMYALPHQTLQEAEQDLRIALDVEPTHLSLYHLTMEPNTVFAKYPPKLPSDDESAEMQQMITQRAAEAGFEHYEVSAYARPGRRSRHNLNYWQFGDYLGIGAGAHSKLSFPHRRRSKSRETAFVAEPPPSWIVEASALAPTIPKQMAGSPADRSPAIADTARKAQRIASMQTVARLSE